MSRLDFSPEEFASRRRMVRQAMREQQLDWLVVIHPVCIHWLTGSDAKSYQEFQCLLVAADDESPLTVMTRAGEYNEFVQDALVDVVIAYGGGENADPVEAFLQLVQHLGLSGSRIGMEVPAYYLHPHHYLRIRDALGASLVAEPTHLVHDLKLVKSPAELACIRQAAAKADAAMAVFVSALRAGCSELSVAGEVMHVLMAQGSALAASPINLVSGERSCFSHGAPTERKLRPGDVGNVEFGATHRRYTATIGRNFSLGTPGARMRELHDLVCRASDACMARIRDGVPASEPHAAAKDVISRAGLEDGRVHLTGYGLAPGFPPGWGEPIHMLADSRHTLRAGMVLSVEPPVFIGAEGLGARVIDNVLVTQHGCEILSRFSRDLIVVDP